MANALTAIIDPRTSPAFGRGVGPEGDYYGVGGGDGMGYLQSLMSLPGSEQFIRRTGSGIDAQTSIDPDALAAYLQTNGLSINDAAQPGARGQRYLTDAGGRMVGDPQQYAYTDTLAEMSLPLALAAGGQMAFGGGFGAAAPAATAGGSAGGAGSMAAADAVYAGTGGFGGAGGAGAASGSLGAAGTAGSAAGAAGGSGMGWADWAQIGASLLSGGMQSNAAENAAASQQAATQQAIAEQRRQYDQTRTDQAPYRAAGVDALGRLQTDINGTPTAAEVMAQPGYQFGLQQGQQALDRKASAAGGRVSGAALKAASQYATDYATTGYNAEYQRRQDRLNRLAALAGIGQTGTQASAGAGNANAISNLQSSMGNAQGAAQLAQGNIWGNAVNQIGAIGQKWAGGGSGGVGAINNGGGYYNLPDYLRNPG